MKCPKYNFIRKKLTSSGKNKSTIHRDCKSSEITSIIRHSLPLRANDFVNGEYKTKKIKIRFEIEKYVIICVSNMEPCFNNLRS